LAGDLVDAADDVGEASLAVAAQHLDRDQLGSGGHAHHARGVGLSGHDARYVGAVAVVVVGAAA
jgi:hypothetical protein